MRILVSTKSVQTVLCVAGLCSGLFVVASPGFAGVVLTYSQKAFAEIELVPKIVMDDALIQSNAATSEMLVRSKRATAQHVGAVMAILGTFDEAGVLPPELDPRANQLIRSLIQFQSVFMKSQEPAVQAYFTAALSDRWGEQSAMIHDSFYEKGWMSESLEAMVDYSRTHAMWQDGRMKNVFNEYYLSPVDWALVQEIFEAARQRFVARKQNIHAVFAKQRTRMAHGEF